MSRLKVQEGIVKDILRTNSLARENDRVLYLEILKSFGCDMNMTVESFFMGTDYPNIESIRRCRQKVQEKYPSLRPPEEIYLKRHKSLRQEYVDYALDKEEENINE